MKNYFLFCLISFFCLYFNVAQTHEIKEDQINPILKKFILENPDLIEKSLLNYSKIKEEKEFETSIKNLKTIQNPTIYGKNSDVIIYEFFDYNCGYCKSVVPDMLEVFNEDKRISIVFVELPILHETSIKAALAALSAHQQKKYLEFHINLMKHNGRIDEKVLFEIAKNINLNISQFKKDFSNTELMSMVDRNRMIAKKLKLNGTPAFVIGKKIYPFAMKKEELVKAINIARKE